MEYSEENTTKEIRQNLVKKALAISISGADIPTTETMKFVREYIEGKEDLKNIKEKVIKRYNENDKWSICVRRWDT